MSVVDCLKEKEEKRTLELLGVIPLSNFYLVKNSSLDIYRKLKKKERVHVVFENNNNNDAIYFPFGINKFNSLIDEDNLITLSCLKGHNNLTGNLGFFCSIQCKVNKEDDEYYLEDYDSNPAFNLPLLKEFYLKNKLYLYNKKSYFNLLNFYKDLKEKEDSTFSLDDSLSFSTSIMYDWIRNYNIGESIPLTKLHGENKDKEFTNYKINNNFIYSYNKILEKIDNDNCVVVYNEFNDIRRLLFVEIVNKAFEEHKSILYAEPNIDLSLIRREKIKNSLWNFMLPINYFDSPNYNLKDEIKNMVLKEKPVLPSTFNKSLYDEEVVLQKIYKSNDIETKTGLLKTGEDALVGLNKFSYYHELRTFSFDLDLSDYSRKTFEKDKKTILDISKNDYVLSDKLKNLDMYSFKNYNSSKLIYNSMISTLKTTIEDIDSFILQLESCYVNEWGLGNIDSIGAYLKARPTINFLLQYNGFPLEMFDLAKDVSAMPIAMRLNDEKKELDSLFEELCENLQDINSLSSEPIKQYYENLKSMNLFKRESAKKKLKSLLIRKKTYSRFIETLEEYLSFSKKYQKDLKENEGKFKLSLYSKDGPETIVNALNFIHDFNNLKKENILFDEKNNTFVNKILNDHSFRLQMRDKFVDADIMVEKLREDFRNFHDFFFIFDNIEEVSFDELRLNLLKKQSINYEKFYQYIEYLNKVKESSYPMQQMIQALTLNNFSLTNLENDYYYSLYKGLAKSYFLSDYVDVKELYKFSDELVKDFYFIFADSMFNTLHKSVKDFFLSSERYEYVEKLYKSYTKIQSQSILDICWGEATLTSPFQVLSYKQLPLTSKVHFDYLILRETIRYDDDSLYCLLSKASKVLVLNDTKDERLKGYESVRVDKECIYESLLSYQNLSNDFLNLLAQGFDENGYELETSEENDSHMPLSFINKKGIRICVVPDALLVGKKNQLSLLGLNFMLRKLKLPPICIVPSMSLVVNPKEVVKKAIENIDEYLKDKD